MQGNIRSVLVVDDDGDDLEMIREALTELEPSLEIILAGSGKEALALLERIADEALPHLILLDYNMHDLTGAEVLRVINADARFGVMPKVIWSTSDSRLYEQISKDGGATHYFKKPDSVKAIQAFAKQLLSLAQ